MQSSSCYHTLHAARWQAKIPFSKQRATKQGGGGCLSSSHFLSHSSGGWKSEFKVQQGWFLPRAVRGFCSYLSPVFLGL